jgi:integrase/recombinase XerD
MPKIETVLDKYLRVYESRNFSSSFLSQVRYGVNEFVQVNRLEKTEAITPGHVDAYQSYLAGRDLAANTRRLKLCVLAKFLTHLKELNKILFDPWIYVTIPKKQRTLPRNVLTEEEVRTLLDLPVLDTVRNLRLRTIVEILYGTGLRKSELLNLDVNDLNMRERTLLVREGKFKKDRVIPMPKTTVRYIGEYIRTYRKKTRTRQKALIVNRTGERMPGPTLQSAIGKLDRLVREKYGFTKRISCHVFRHSIATHLLERGVDLRYIQAFLGHSSLDSTQIYTHIAPMELKKEIFRTHPREKMNLKL